MRYFAPTSVEEATAALAAGPARVFAGATDVIPQSRSGRPLAETMIDLKRIDRLDVDRGEGHPLGDRRRGADGAPHRGRHVHRAVPRAVRGGRTDRLGPGPEPGQPRREPLQRVTGRRLGAGHGRRTASRAVVVAAGRHPHHPRRRHRHRTGPHVARPRRDRRRVRDRPAHRRAPATPTCASSPAPRWTSRWSGRGARVSLAADGTVPRGHRRPGRGGAHRRGGGRRRRRARGTGDRRRRPSLPSPPPPARRATPSTTSEAPSTTGRQVAGVLAKRAVTTAAERAGGRA